MKNPVRILMVGGGISGLTLANLLVRGTKGINFHVTLFEARRQAAKTSVGGGIGLWPPSQSVLRNIPNFQGTIEKFSHTMPSPSYRDSQGRILARAHDNFSDRFPVQCLDRDDLINMLSDGLKHADNVEIVLGQPVHSYERQDDCVVIRTNEDKTYEGDVLIGCDGIHSKIRNCLMSELNLPPVSETGMDYTYFRANAKIPTDSGNKWWSEAFETWGECKSQKYGNHTIRFGYIPLKPPNVFWFISIKTQKNHKYLSPVQNVELIDDNTKEFLMDLVQSWKPITTPEGDTAVDYAELLKLTDKILRTDIAKIEGVDTFPWTSKDNRIVLMGDAAHATAPNIAQGAGLCIEDAASLASRLNRADYLQGIKEYENERKSRAKTVQNFSDLVALTGQAENSLFSALRNYTMRTATNLLPGVQRGIFENTVSVSLGGSRHSLFWQVPRLFLTDDAPATVFGQVFPHVFLLDKHVRDFKTSLSGGSGSGVVTVEKPGLLAKAIGAFSNFPKEMTKQPFHAEIINLSRSKQQWKRIFGYKTPDQKSYSTTHSAYCGSDCQMYSNESLGGWVDHFFQFNYRISLQPDRSLRYESQGMILFNSFRLPLPSFLLPKSEWVEKPIPSGWEFSGKISLPVLGPMLNYHGRFQIEKIDPVQNKRIIIAGGSGMIGKAASLMFIKKGYDVYCLTRSSDTSIGIDGVKLRRIDDDWSDLIDPNTIILNLSGANPGARRWSTGVKAEIAESRFHSIEIIIRNIKNAKEKPLKYLQASAAGYYGDAGESVLTECSQPIIGNEPGTKFRVTVCQEIEKKANEANCNVINLRIGHVLSNHGGLLPYCRLAGLFGVGRFGSGRQFVPFVHIDDVAKAIEYIANNENFTDGAINIAAPKSCTNAEMLHELRLIKWAPMAALPESILKLTIGESSAILTDSERVQPDRLLNDGFTFEYPDIKQSLNGLR